VCRAVRVARTSDQDRTEDKRADGEIRESGQGGCSAGVVTANRPAGDGVQDRPRPDEGGQAQQGRVPPGNGGDADADVAAHLQDCKGPGEATKRRRRDQVQRAARHQCEARERCQGRQRPINGHQRNAGDDSHPTGDRSLHGVNADITDRPQEREPAVIFSTLALAMTA
jgi:type IV secretory pathway VirB10-like protein